MLTTALLSAAWAFRNFSFFFGFTYRYVEIKTEIIPWVDELDHHFSGHAYKEKLVKQAFEKELAQDYLECVENNAKINDFKAGVIYRTNFYLLFAVIISILNWILKAAS